MAPALPTAAGIGLRPAFELALESRDPDVWGIGQHKFGPISLGHVAQMYGIEADIDWQVQTCANRAQPNGTDAPSCPQGTGIYHPDAEGSPQNQATDWDSHTRQLPDR